jgi:DNA primase
MIKTHRLEKLNRLVLAYYIKCLNRSHRAQAYLYNRISKKIAKRYYVGYAPKGGLVSYLNKYGVKEKDAKALGLVYIDYEGTASEYFSDRIMFPIIHANRIVGFGGRTISNAKPKYLNSKSSVLYNKSAVLYGLWKARQATYNQGYGILLEGYFDVLAFATHGVQNCFSVCGTSLTQDQARALKRYTSKVYVMFDGDSAGNEAAKNAKKVLKKEHIYGGRIVLPKNLDPDEFINKYGKKKLKSLEIKK